MHISFHHACVVCIYYTIARYCITIRHAHIVVGYNLHCTEILTFLVVLQKLLLAEHLYTPVCTLLGPITISSTLTLVTLPTPVDDIFIGLPDTNLLVLRLLPSLFCHTTVGTN